MLRLTKRMGVIGFGIIVRSMYCQHAAVYIQIINVDPTMVEAWTALHVVLFSKEVGFFYVIPERDALQIVNEINSGNLTWSIFVHFTDGIKTELNSFWSSSVAHVSREGSSAAQVLAKAAVAYVINSIWLEEIPPKHL